MDTLEDGYHPPAEFQEDMKDPLVGISSTGSTELWLVQWPLNQLEPKDFEGKELSLKLNRDGQLGSFESSSGKSYELVSFAAQEPNATVFLPSSLESKVVGKISRRVCLVHYPDPSSSDKSSSRRWGRGSQGSGGSSRMDMSHRVMTPSWSGKAKSSQTMSGLSHGHPTSTHSSKLRGSGMTGGTSFESFEPKHSNQKHVESPNESSRSIGRSTRDSGGRDGWSSISSLGFTDSSHAKKSKKRIKVEE